MTIIKYPQCMLPTSRGLVPHLTKDYVDALPFSLAEFSLSTIFESDLFVNQGKTLKEVYKFTNHTNICSMAPLINPGISLQKNSITFRTHNGKKTIPLEQLVKSLCSLQSDGILAIGPGEEHKGIEHLSIKSKLKSIERVRNFVDQLIQNNLSLYAPLYWDSCSEIMADQLKYLQQNDQYFIGYWMNSNTLKRLDQSYFGSKTKIIVGCTSITEILDCIDIGGDIFDSRYPAELTEDGFALVASFNSNPNSNGSLKLNLWDPCYKTDTNPIIIGCKCFSCSRHTRCYIHHLLNVNEMLGLSLLSYHNLYQFALFFEQVRHSINDGTFIQKKKEFLSLGQPEFIEKCSTKRKLEEE